MVAALLKEMVLYRNQKQDRTHRSDTRISFVEFSISFIVAELYKYQYMFNLQSKIHKHAQCHYSYMYMYMYVYY